MKHVATLLAVLLLVPAAGSASAADANKPEILVVGVAHLVAKADLHNATWGEDALQPAMQKQIKAAVAKLAAFRPTKVMIEALASNPMYVKRYKAYLAGRYTLGPNEDDQFGYRLAALAHNPTIYPIDAQGFPFNYDSVKASAKAHGQTQTLHDAEAHIQPLVSRSNALEKQDRLLDLLRYLNTPQALAANAAWYMYVDRIGDAKLDYAGADLTSDWYARNLHIFANVVHPLKPGDRVVVIIGQGHAAMLRRMIQISPFVQDVDPERYLK